MADFLIQKLHPSLLLGHRPRIATSRALVFCAQGDWSSSCVLASSAMAVAMLGYIANPADVRWRNTGVSSRFWRLAEPYYHTGMALSELIDMLARLNPGLRTSLLESSHQVVLDFCEVKMKRGELVVLSYRPRSSQLHHAVLVVGIEGLLTSKNVSTSALASCLLNPIRSNKISANSAFVTVSTDDALSKVWACGIARSSSRLLMFILRSKDTVPMIC